MFLAQTNDAVYVAASDMTYLAASDSFARQIGLSDASELIGKNAREVMRDGMAAQKRMRDDMQILERGEALVGFDEQMNLSDGRKRHMMRSQYPIPGKDGRAAGVLCVLHDATGAHEEAESYRQEIQYLMQLHDDAYGVWLADVTAWRLIQVSTADEEKHMPVARRETLDEYLRAAAEAASNNQRDIQEFFASFSLETLTALYRSGKRRVDYEYNRTAPDGRNCWVHLIVRLLREPENGHLMAVVTMTDIDRAKAAEHALIQAAEIDSMTGVLNHDAALGHMSRYLTGEGASGTHALFMVDRDALKRINDTLGHQTGDDIIIETARTLKSVFRDTDILGRVGGDEFLILMKNVGQLRQVQRKAGELLQSLQCICGPADNTMESTGSIGVSFYQGDHKTLDKLYAEADAALYKAKAEGRNRYAIYDLAAGGAAADGERDALMDTVNLRTLLNSIDGGILILHTEPGKPLSPVFFSDSFLNMMGGLTQEEAFALYGGDGLFSCIHPDECERVRLEYAAALESGEPLRTTYRLMGKDQTYYWLSAGTNIIKNAGGKTDVYAVHTNIEKLMHREEKLASDELRYRMAFSQTSRMLCEVDVAADTIAFYARDEREHIPELLVSGLPEGLIANGFIHPDSADAFRAFHAEMLEGRQADKVLLRLRYFSNELYGWAAISYQMVYDAAGKPQKAIGSIEELPGIARAQARLERETRLQKTVRDDLLMTMRVNLSRDTIEALHAEEGCCFADLTQESYSAFAEAAVKLSPYPEDAMLLQLNLTHDNLVEANAAGKHWTSVEYRRVEGGEIRWTKVSVCLIEDPVTRELYAFLYVGDVEKRRSAEAVLPVTTERDPVTYLYTQSTAEKLVEGLMRGAGASDRLYSLAVIHMADLPALSARIGVENMDLEQMYLGRFLCMLLDGDCIVGRHGADGFLVFCPDALSDEWMREKIESAVFRVRGMRSASDPELPLRMVCGVATERANNADFAGLLAQATRVCEAGRNAETDQIVTFEQFVDSFRVTEEALKRSAFRAVEPEEIGRPLFGAERSALTECLAAMLAADRYDESVNGALGVLGKYYQAQRVYTLSLLSGNVAVSGLHEWVAPGKHSTLRQLTGMTLEKLPMFKRALTVARPIVMNGVERNDRAVRSDDGPWCFLIAPVITGGKVIGFLCIENAKRHKTDVALPVVLIPKLLHERTRFGMNAAGFRIAGRDDLTGLQDHAAYNSAMQSFNPDAFHAVGAFYLSVVNLRELNRVSGVKYGDDMLVFAAQTLTDVFKKDQVYRMSGAEFSAVSTNMSSEAFRGQCARVQSILQRRYPKKFCYGSAWSDKSASARKLLSDAESLAHNGIERMHASISKPGLDEENAEEIVKGLADGRYYILLQPQVDMRTGKVSGAEALARCRDTAGRTILPNEFIHLFEKEGIIRELDYFVLNQTFRTLQDWIGEGLAPIPISINFSRQTLLSNTVLASSLAIRSRYDVPEHLVEIEVTESIGDFEPGTLRAVMDGMCQQGFRFVLDDLGSEYSSLKTLGDLSFGAIKLDKSLIDSFLYNSMSRSVVESIVGLCAKNDIKCVAEGVKSEEHVKSLLESGCIYAQGYYYGKPMTPEDFKIRYMRKR